MNEENLNEDVEEEFPEFIRKENIKDKQGNKLGSENYDPTTLLIEES